MKYLTNHFSCHDLLRAKNAQAAARLNDDAYLINANEPPGATDPSTTIRWRKLATKPECGRRDAFVAARESDELLGRTKHL